MDDEHLIAPRALADRLAAADEAYIRSGHVALEHVAAGRLDEVRAAMAAGRLPAPAYVLDDGTAMVARDHLAWAGYLSGAYAMCLRSATPEAIARKEGWSRNSRRCWAIRAPGDATWRAALRSAVDALDALERPFAPLDEHRFGARPTRHRLIDDPRARWPWLAA
jgi:hypothetical protein